MLLIVSTVLIAAYQLPTIPSPLHDCEGKQCEQLLYIPSVSILTSLVSPPSLSTTTVQGTLLQCINSASNSLYPQCVHILPLYN